MSDSVLKKQFKKHDVERLRNLIKGKSGNKTTTGIGYKGEESINYKEGDIWEENGKKWTIRDGIKENITKLDKFKKVSVPIFCPKCKQNMDGQLDSHYYKAYGECVDCRATTETKLKNEGKWKEYVTTTFNKEIDINIEEYKKFMEDMLSESNNNYVTEAGDVENWKGSINKELANQSVSETIKYLESLKR